MLQEASIVKQQHNNRAERRWKTRLKLKQREKLMAMLGMQGGTVYQKHRDKVRASSGYMRDGNVSHYVCVKLRKYTQNRDRYGAPHTPSRHDAVQLDVVEETFTLDEVEAELGLHCSEKDWR